MITFEKLKPVCLYVKITETNLTVDFKVKIFIWLSCKRLQINQSCLSDKSFGVKRAIFPSVMQWDSSSSSKWHENK